MPKPRYQFYYKEDLTPYRLFMFQPYGYSKDWVSEYHRAAPQTRTNGRLVSRQQNFDDFFNILSQRTGVSADSLKWLNQLMRRGGDVASLNFSYPEEAKYLPPMSVAHAMQDAWRKWGTADAVHEYLSEYGRGWIGEPPIGDAFRKLIEIYSKDNPDIKFEPSNPPVNNQPKAATTPQTTPSNPNVNYIYQNPDTLGQTNQQGLLPWLNVLGNGGYLNYSPYNPRR